GRVPRAHEHQVLEQVREAGAPRRLVLRADVVPEVDGDEGAAAIDVQNDRQAVRQDERLEFDLHAAAARGVIVSHETMPRPLEIRGAVVVGALAVFGVVSLAAASPALANGAFPESYQIVLPADRPQQVILATNFGLIISDDDGATWTWTCEQKP